MVLFVYSCISPLTNFIVAFVFLGLQTLLRHQFVYIYPTVPDSGGKLFENFIKIMVTCMIIAEITLLGLLGLKKASVASPLFIPLLVSVGFVTGFFVSDSICSYYRNMFFFLHLSR